MSVAAPPRAGTAQRPQRPPVPWTVWAGVAVFVAITLWAALEPLGGIGFTLVPLFSEQLIAGREILADFFNPEWSFLLSDRVIQGFTETLTMAIIASFVGCGLAMPVALYSSKVTNRSAALYQAWRTLLSMIRSLPDVAWALLFVAAVGTGALPGILALTVFNIGVVAKLTSETVDGIDPGPLEAADAVGSGRVQRAWSAVIPQVLPTYLSYSLYVFELNIRASVVIGFVGAGGIGNVINVARGQFNWNRVGALIALLFVVVVALDQVSRAIRKRLV